MLTPPPAPTSLELPTHLLCAVGPLTLGFEALLVREVMAMPLVTPLTQAAPLVAGALNLRGRVVPVLDLRAALELEITPPRACDSLVVLESGDRIAAVRVDEVRDVQLLADVQFANAPSSASFVTGIARQNTALVQLINLETIFAATFAPPDVAALAARVPGLQTEGENSNWRAVWFAPAPGEREIFEARARALAAPLEGTSAHGADAPLMAAAVLSGELFGFDLKSVREFAPLPALTRVPLGPPQVKGLLNLRGEILPLLDIRHALGMEAAPPLESNEDSHAQSRMEVIVIEHEGARLAIWVEQVLDVFAATDAIAAVSAQHEATELLRGVVAYQGRMLAVLDLPKLMDRLTKTTGRLL